MDPSPARVEAPTYGVQGAPGPRAATQESHVAETSLEIAGWWTVALLWSALCWVLVAVTILAL